MKITGTNGEDPFYAGLQKWWVEVTLPQASVVKLRDPAPLPDPASPNGGSCRIDLLPQQVGNITLQFSMPDSDSLPLRRQPGGSTVHLAASDAICPRLADVDLSSDVVLDLHALCR